MTAVTEYKSQSLINFFGDKPWAALDVINHGLQWMSHSKILSPYVDAQFVMYAASDACKTVEDSATAASKTVGYFSGSANGTEVMQSARKASVTSGNFLSNAADAVGFASAIGFMKAIPGLSVIGNVGGIWSKSFEIYNSYGNFVSESAKPDTYAKALKKNNIMFDILFRVSIIAIKMLALAPVMLGMTFCSTSFLITSTAILVADLGAYNFDTAYKSAIAP